mgnify:CR=1 FL=1
MKRGPFPPCKQAWCASCYVQEGPIEFVVRQTLDEEGNVIVKNNDTTRFLIGRDGDHLMTPFQCEICHFRNICTRDPHPILKSDQLALVYMRRVNLDAFWKSSSSTVLHNCGQISRCLATGIRLGISDMLPPLGPFPLEDSLGMKAAMAVLDKSLDKGSYEKTVQWATFRRTRGAIANYHQASMGGMTDRVGAYEKNKIWISKAPTFGFFFSRFMNGIHKRVGETVIRDEPLTIDMMQHIDEHLHNKWRSAHEQEPRDLMKLLKVARQGMWCLGGFCSALRGEEMIMMELAGTRASVVFLTSPRGSLGPHYDMVVSGPTKGNQISGAKFKIPICGTTHYSGLRPGIWCSRLCALLTEQGRTKGYLFGFTDSHHPQLKEFHDIFYEVLEEVQEARPDLIKPEVEVRELFGILRTLRRSATAHATNMRIPKDIIEAINRWRREKNSDVPALDMQGVCARLDFIKPTVLMCSESF